MIDFFNVFHSLLKYNILCTNVLYICVKVICSCRDTHSRPFDASNRNRFHASFIVLWYRDLSWSGLQPFKLFRIASGLHKNLEGEYDYLSHSRILFLSIRKSIVNSNSIAVFACTRNVNIRHMTSLVGRTEALYFFSNDE